MSDPATQPDAQPERPRGFPFGPDASDSDDSATSGSSGRRPSRAGDFASIEMTPTPEALRQAIEAEAVADAEEPKAPLPEARATQPRSAADTDDPEASVTPGVPASSASAADQGGSPEALRQGARTTAAQTAGPTASDKPRPLSTDQMQHRLRVELASAELNNYPFSLVIVRLDEIEGVAYPTLCRRLLPLVVKHMQRLTAGRSKRALGMLRGPCLITGFPHVTANQAEEIASDLLARIRRIELPEPHQGNTVTLSAGIAHNAFTGEITLDTLVEDAENSLRLAISNGGDRSLRWRDVEDEVEDLRRELDTTIETIKTSSKRRAKIEAQWTDEFIQKTVALFQKEPQQSEGVIRVMNGMIALVDGEVARLCKLTQQAVPSGGQDVVMLERRIQKLNESLSRTEAELKRIASMKDIDDGVASIYRTVQGLGDGEDAEQKREMLAGIFEANLALQTGG